MEEDKVLNRVKALEAMLKKVLSYRGVEATIPEDMFTEIREILIEKDS